MSHLADRLICKSRDENGLTLILAPSVGHWEDRPTLGTLVRAGDRIGTLSLLGRRYALVIPAGVFGEIVGGLAEEPERELDVGYGDVLLRLDPEAAGRDARSLRSEEPSAGANLVFTSPSSGRFWRRPSPDAPAFVSDGMEISTGQPVGLLEVMKTFTRLSYGGDDLPDRARVVRVVPEDGADVEHGSVILELEEL